MNALNTYNNITSFPFSLIITTFIVHCLCTGCSGSSSIEKTLSRFGSNRDEIELVLDHFKNDKFKYDAAYFLIENMETKYYYEGWPIDTLKSIKIHGRMNDDQMAEWEWFDYSTNCKKVNHSNIITSQILIDNVDKACDVWKSRPWHKYYSFEDFCEYVLPYCIGDEPIEEWRTMYYDRYAFIADSILSMTTDVVAVASAIAKELKNEGFDNHADVALPHLGPSYLMKNRVGYCRENCDIATYAMRALGIPIATDFYVTSPSYNSRHFWNAIIDTSGVAIPFNYTEQPLCRNSKPERKMGKVFRYMFGKQVKNNLETVSQDFPTVFVHPFIKDVSHEYFYMNAPLEIHSSVSEQSMFLCIYNGRRYEAIATSSIINGKTIFKDIENDIIVFPTILINGDMRPCGYPVLTGNTNHHVFNPNTNIQSSITLKRKYPIINTLKYISNMIGGKLKASNDNLFNNSITICEFKDTLRSNNVILNYNNIPVRYLKYTAPSNKNIEIAELHVFDENGIEIPFKDIKADHPIDSLHTRNLKLIYDNIWSSFYMSDKGESLTFDFGEPVEISEILFVPRNDDNFIRKGQLYELYFHDGPNGWLSLGQKIAESDSIVFDNIPENAVLWLHNHTEGIEERCFYKVNGKQVFI